jgi:hypothetical protein
MGGGICGFDAAVRQVVQPLPSRKAWLKVACTLVFPQPVPAKRCSRTNGAAENQRMKAALELVQTPGALECEVSRDAIKGEIERGVA